MKAQNKPLVSLQFRRKSSGNSWTRAHGVWEDMPEKKTWDFVGEFLPNYDHDSDVTYSNDLSCIIDGTWTREKFDGYYPAHEGDSIEDLQKILEKTDAGLYERAEKYLDEAIKSGVIEVRELEIAIVSARISGDTNVWLWDVVYVELHIFGNM